MDQDPGARQSTPTPGHFFTEDAVTKYSPKLDAYIEARTAFIEAKLRAGIASTRWHLDRDGRAEYWELFDAAIEARNAATIPPPSPT